MAKEFTHNHGHPRKYNDHFNKNGKIGGSQGLLFEQYRKGKKVEILIMNLNYELWSADRKIKKDSVRT